MLTTNSSSRNNFINTDLYEMSNLSLNKFSSLENEMKKSSIESIQWYELVNMEIIDQGNFGLIKKVFIFIRKILFRPRRLLEVRAYWTKSKSYVVCKTMTNMKGIQDKQYDAFIRELRIQKQLNA
ncbi:40731_t:CDS:2, partial [Gigaspora margarita]